MCTELGGVLAATAISVVVLPASASSFLGPTAHELAQADNLAVSQPSNNLVQQRRETLSHIDTDSCNSAEAAGLQLV